jgi:hypothetical protein
LISLKSALTGKIKTLKQKFVEKNRECLQVKLAKSRKRVPGTVRVVKLSLNKIGYGTYGPDNFFWNSMLRLFNDVASEPVNLSKRNDFPINYST